MSVRRFVFITDSHLGCDENGHQMQSRYLGQDVELYEGLGRWLKEQDVSFVVHGGDMTDHGSLQEIEYANGLCERLKVPVYVCLGNHDLIQPDSMRHWQTTGGTSHGRFLPGGRDCFGIDAGSVMVVVVSHHWNPKFDHRWVVGESQAARLDGRQQEALQRLLREAGRPAIAVTHMVLNPISAEQRNAEGPLYPPPPSYLSTWQRIGQANRNLRLVMCGHNHTHTRYDHESFISCTTGAFNERPAQLRLITIDSQSIKVETVAFAEVLGLPVELNPASDWCVGPVESHTISIPF